MLAMAFLCATGLVVFMRSGPAGATGGGVKGKSP
jgi:hypothetical protein